jgi:hypothetical protein
VNCYPLRETEKAAVPGSGDFGVWKTIESLVIFVGFNSIIPRRMTIPQVVFWSKPVPFTVTIVPPCFGPRAGEISLLNKQGYAIDAENSWFDVYITLDGGSQLSDSNGRFEYYSDPFINEISPALGPKHGGTIVTVNGTGFDQNTTCGIVIRLGIIELKPTKITSDSMVFHTPKSPLPGTAAFSVSLNG